MIRKKGGLGRGLDALLGAGAAARSEAPSDSGFSETLRSLPVERIVRGRYQPRQDLREDTLHELAESIRAQGVVQPIVVRPQADGYEIVADERRWRAAQEAGWQTVPALVRQTADTDLLPEWRNGLAAACGHQGCRWNCRAGIRGAARWR